MANLEHVAILKQGAVAWNDWRKQNPDVHPNLGESEFRNTDFRQMDLSWTNLRQSVLVGAILTGNDLCEANLFEAVLSGASLNGADLRWAILDGASLSDAKMRGVDLSHATLTSANLSKADLTEAKLVWANLRGANLSQANLSSASIAHTIFGRNDLSSTKGLETIRHHGPSTVGIDTLYQSKGAIPPDFLRGVGVPETLIKYLPSLLDIGIEFYSCFISYSTKDQEFADRLYADLQNKGVRCWFAPHDMKSGKKVHDQIDEAIRLYDRLLLILSESSMASNWVKTEIANARQKEVTQNRQVLFPIGLAPFETIRQWKCFDADTGIDSAREIREYLIPDFSRWKDHDSYRKGFDRLLRDLKSENPKA